MRRKIRSTTNDHNFLLVECRVVHNNFLTNKIIHRFLGGGPYSGSGAAMDGRVAVATGGAARASLMVIRFINYNQKKKKKKQTPSVWALSIPIQTCIGVRIRVQDQRDLLEMVAV